MSFALQQVYQYYKLHPVQLIINVMICVIFVTDDLVVPLLTGKIVTAIENKKPWVKLAIILTVVLIVMQFVYAGNQWHDSFVVPGLQNFIRHNMTQGILEFYKNAPSDPEIGQIMSNIVKLPYITVQLLEAFRDALIPYFLSFLFTAVLIMKYDLQLGVTITVLVIMVYIITIMSPIRCSRETNDQNSKLSVLDDEVEDILRNIQTINLASNVPYEMNRLRQFEREYEKSYRRTMNCVFKIRASAIVVLAIMLIFFFYRTNTLIKTKALSAGGFVTIFIIISQWFGTLGWIASNVRDIVIDWGILGGYHLLLQKIPKQNTKYEAIDVPATGIALDHVSYAIGDKKILSDISLYIPLRENIAIIGEIGGGKSTLVKLLTGLKMPTEGAIYINGKRVDDIQRNIAYVSQNPILFNRTIYENITYGVPDATEEKVKALLKQLQVEELLDLHAKAGKNGSRLSGGQRQVLSCVRTILRNPDIIVLDEITANLDNKTKSILMRILDVMFENKTVILITHDDDLLKIASEVLIMENGKLYKRDGRG